MAIRWSNLGAVEALMHNGADVNALSNGIPAFANVVNLAINHNHPELVDTLIAEGADFSQKIKITTGEEADTQTVKTTLELLQQATVTPEQAGAHRQIVKKLTDWESERKASLSNAPEPAPVVPEVPAEEPVVTESVSTPTEPEPTRSFEPEPTAAPEPPAPEEPASHLPPPAPRTAQVAVVEPVPAQRPEEQLPPQVAEDLKFLGIRRPEQLETKLPDSVKPDGKIDPDAVAEAAVEKAIKKADGGLFKLKDKDGVVSEKEFEKLLRRNPEAAATLQRHGVTPQKEDEIREIKDHQKEDRRLGRGDDTPDDERRRPLRELGKGLKAALSGEGRVRDADDDNKSLPPRAERHNREVAGRD